MAARSGAASARLGRGVGQGSDDVRPQFLATQIENDNTRAAYLRAAREFLAWYEGEKLRRLADI